MTTPGEKLPKSDDELQEVTHPLHDIYFQNTQHRLLVLILIQIDGCLNYTVRLRRLGSGLWSVAHTILDLDLNLNRAAVSPS